jgi:hypothetical protein
MKRAYRRLNFFQAEKSEIQTPARSQSRGEFHPAIEKKFIFG